MPRSGLTGTRIREQRMLQGVRQGALAKSVGISAPYLNLIEHNRRRIAGKLLNDIARELTVDAKILSQGAEQALVTELLDAAAVSGEAETRRADDFAGRFPGWAGLVAAQRRRIETLEHTVSALNDRMNHDPQLAASLHEVLSVVTAIRSTSAILARNEDVDPDWQARFHRNLFEDAQRLAQSSQGLVEYLDNSENDPGDGSLHLPQEDLELWLAARQYHIAELEGPAPVDLAGFLADQPGLIATQVGAAMAATYLERYRGDAMALPLATLAEILSEGPVDPLAIAAQFGCDLARVFRRLACLPGDVGGSGFGLVVCDSSGTLTFRKPISGFAQPKFGAACPLWPLYQVLSRPMTPLRSMVEQSGHRPARFLTFAVAQPRGKAAFNAPALFEATMLIQPEIPGEFGAGETVLPIGPSCRICPREICDARREPSILTSGF